MNCAANKPILTNNLQKGNDLIPRTTGEQALIRYLKENELLVKQGAILDIGANVGGWSKGFLDVDRSYGIHLFEPAPATYESLLRNFSAENRSSKLFFNACAVGQSEESKLFYHYKDNPSWSTFYRRKTAERKYGLNVPDTFYVPTITVDEYCRSHHINRISFMKIDVEGSEIDVLEGGRRMFAEGKIDYFQFEYGGTYLDAGTSLRRVFHFATENDYTIFRLAANQLEVIPEFMNIHETYQYSNFFAVHKRLLSLFLRQPPSMLDLNSLMKKHGILPRGVMHIGAHDGKEANQYLDMGVQKAVFIEANPRVYSRLKQNLQGIPGCICVNAAVTNQSGSATLNVMSMDQSSSILPLKRHKEIYPEIVQTDTISVKAITIDELMSKLQLTASDINILNIDIQGAELLALEGGKGTLESIDMINTEVNFEELYEGCALIDEMDQFLGERGFRRVAMKSPYHPSWGDAVYVKKPGISMSTLGTNGRFANQIFQYAFLKVYAKRNNLRVETPEWIGRTIFGCEDPPISRGFPQVYQGSKRHTDDPLVNTSEPHESVDFWGYFQYHTSYYRPDKAYFKSLFRPVAAIKKRLDEGLCSLRSMGKTIVGLHLRRGDYGYAYFFIAPNRWYKSWLAETWKSLEDPILFIASDEPEKVVGDFSDYDPVTSRDLGMDLPEADFYPDFYLLSQCDLLAISNSSFSFAAAMLNDRAQDFFRPHLPSRRLIPFDPWDSEIIFRDARIEDVKTEGIELAQTQKDGSALGSEVERRCLEKRSENVWFFALGKREFYRPTMFSPTEVFLGPDCEDATNNGKYHTVKTPIGTYDVGGIIHTSPLPEPPQMAIVKADATGRNMPVNLWRLGCPKVLILGNTQHLKTPIQSLLKYAVQEKFDFIISDHKRHHLHFFSEAGFDNVYWIPGLNIWPHEEFNCEEKIYDVTFVGQAGRWHPYRRYILDHLKRKDVPLTEFQVPQREAAKIYAQSHINLNISLNGDLNLRIFEVLSSGGFLMTDKLSFESGLGLLFKDGEHLVQFSDEKDLIGKINYFLKHPDESRKIARNGYEEYKRNHTPNKKVTELMELVSGGVIKPLCDAKQDKRALYPDSSDSKALMKRVAIYEFCQELHLDKPQMSVIAWPGVDMRIICDLIDLPRLNIRICGEKSDLPPRASVLLEVTKIAARIGFSDQRTVFKEKTETDLVLMTSSEVYRIGIQRLLNGMNFRWLVITVADKGMNIGMGEAISETLANSGFSESEEFSRADEGRLVFRKHRQKEKNRGGGIMEYSGSSEGQQGKNEAKSPHDLYENVRQLIDSGKNREAIGALRMLLAMCPDYAMGHNDLGVLYYKEGEKDMALQHYEQAAQLEPQNAIFQKNLADIYCVEFGKLEDGLKIYLKLLENNPTDIETLSIIGDVCVSLGKTEDAKVFFNRVLELEPWNMEAQDKMESLNPAKSDGVPWTEDESQETIITGLEQGTCLSMERAGESLESAYENVEKLVDQGNQVQAIRELEKLMETYPEYGLVHNDLGVLYFKQGDKERAQQHYEQAVLFEPNNAIFQKNLADFYCVEAGKLEEGLKIYLKLLEDNPTDIETLLILGDICQSLEKGEDARVFYDRVLELEPWNLEAGEKLDSLTT